MWLSPAELTDLISIIFLKRRDHDQPESFNRVEADVASKIGNVDSR